MPVQTVIKLRRDTAANWDTTNPVLAAGEMGIETDTSLHKFGDGTTAWGALQYSSSSRITQQVKNTTGSLISKGSVVYISGATGGEALISLADADSEATSSKVIGLTTTAISNDALGMVIEQGLLVGVNTASATAGQSVWLSSTAGQFVFGAPPAKPAHSVYLGVVVRVHATEGEILVKVQNGYELNELHDVDAGSPTTGQVLQWNGSMWVNASVDALPSQSGQSGKYLTTDGTTASWGTITIPPGTTVSDTAPSSPSVGQLWWESDTGILYIYYDGFWVEATAGIVGPQGDSGVVKGATAPTDTSVLWIDTTEAGDMVLPAGGTTGQVLTKASNSNYDSTWSSLPAGGDKVWTQLINQSISTGATTFVVTGLASYDSYVVRIAGLSTTGTSSDIYLHPNSSTSGNSLIVHYGWVNGSTQFAPTVSTDSGQIWLGTYNGSASNTVSAIATFTGGKGSSPAQVSWMGGSNSFSPGNYMNQGSGIMPKAASISSFTISCSANIDAGTIQIWGA